jgi:hypothetical protein
MAASEPFRVETGTGKLERTKLGADGQRDRNPKGKARAMNREFWRCGWRKRGTGRAVSGRRWLRADSDPRTGRSVVSVEVGREWEVGRRRRAED